MLVLLRTLALCLAVAIAWATSAGLITAIAIWAWDLLRFVWTHAHHQLYDFLAMYSNDHLIPRPDATPALTFHSHEFVLGWGAAIASVGIGLHVLLYALTPMSWLVRQTNGNALVRLDRGHDAVSFVKALKRRSGYLGRVQVWLSDTAEPEAYALSKPFVGAVVVSKGLLAALSPAERVWLLSHEFAHIRYRDALPSAGWLLANRGLHLVTILQLKALGLIQRVLASNVVTFLLVYPVRVIARTLIVCITLGRRLSTGLWLALDSWVSRRMEYRADAYAARHVGWEPGVTLMRRLGTDCEPLWGGLFASHPSTRDRVAALASYADKASSGEWAGQAE